MKGVVRGLTNSLLVVTLLSGASVWAAQTKQKDKSTAMVAHVTLDEIKQIKAQEGRGDELYFSVTEYSSVQQPRTYLVPNFPTHWLSAHLKELKSVVLWEKPLQDKESVMLVISLLERDAPPWNVDDLIGTVKINVHNDGGTFSKKVTIPNKDDTVQSDATHYSFTGDASEYHVKISIGH